jgi:hypothetical protein
VYQNEQPVLYKEVLEAFREKYPEEFRRWIYKDYQLLREKVLRNTIADSNTRSRKILPFCFFQGTRRWGLLRGLNRPCTPSLHTFTFVRISYSYLKKSSAINSRIVILAAAEAVRLTVIH